jgi:hypothetical protein
LLASYNIPVFVTDGGSPDPFIRFLKSFPHFTVAQAEVKGLMAQITHSVSAAGSSRKPFLLYTEPDKKFFFEALPAFLEEAPSREEEGIFLASRAAAGFASYPAFQQMTETCINNCCTEVTDLYLDYTYGPFLMNRQLAPYLSRVTEDIGWGWRPFMFIMAKRLGLRLGEYRGEYLAPPEQRTDTAPERLYRMKQLEQNIRGTLLAAGFPLNL